ncbi:TadE/TadG family type IV pilus assembly protein [Trueperella pyogenes]|uniref:TadE/TadG family type IV pilus assembly protein n=1 Tax=Trueperella pyogenes TaxID=1661 RepID=UPI0032466C55
MGNTGNRARSESARIGRRGEAKQLRSSEDGVVTAEFAIITPVFVFLGFVLTSLILLGWQHVAIANEAREIAREVSIKGETQLAAQAEGSGADVKMSLDGEILTVTVRRPGRGIYSWVDMELTGQHRVVMEPGSAHSARGLGNE